MLFALAALAVLSGDRDHPATRPVRFNEVKVYIRVISVDANSGRCWEPLDFCGKPDYFVTAGGGGPEQANMFTTSVVLNAMHVGNPVPPDWSGGPFIAPRPGRLTLAVYDADGPPRDDDGDGSMQNEMRSATDQADIDPGPNQSVTVDLEPLIGVGERTMTFTGNDTQLVVAILVELLPGRLADLRVSPAEFRPSDGVPVEITAVGTGGPSLTFTISGPDGRAVFRTTAMLPSAPASAPPGQEAQVTVRWSGLDEVGVPLPPGTYQVEVQGVDPMPVPSGRASTIPESRSVAVIVRPALTVPTLAFQGLDPKIWAPEAGPLLVTVSSNMAINVQAKVFAGFYCAGTPVAAWTIGPLAPGTPTGYPWNGTTAAGSVVTPGAYNLQLIGDAPNLSGLPLCTRFDVVTAPTPLIVVRHTPFLASPGQTVTFTALAVDPAGLPRRVNKLEVSAEAVAYGAPLPGSAPAPLASCTNTATCSATLTLPASQAQLVWKADAKDGAGAVNATSGWRRQRINNWASLAGTSGFATPVDEGVSGSLSTNPLVESATGFDILFNVSTQFQWSNPQDLTDIGNALDNFMQRLWGLEGFDTPAGTTFLTRPGLVRIYLALDQTEVSWSGNTSMCTWSVPSAPWADARGVLHRASCRDNASFWMRAFSAKLGSRDVIVHELHHALFGLADEYVDVSTAMGLGGDGGYGVSAELPNVFNNLADCQVVANRPPGGCTSIAEVVQGSIPPRLSGRVFFRLDDPTMLDIMDQNGRQQFAERRQARYREAACADGDC